VHWSFNVVHRLSVMRPTAALEQRTPTARAAGYTVVLPSPDIPLGNGSPLEIVLDSESRIVPASIQSSSLI
jgi:hypothetical protein